MGRHIVEQPNGYYAIWSTVVDDFVHYNMTAQNIIDMRIFHEVSFIEEEVNRQIKRLDKQYTIEYYMDFLKGRDEEEYKETLAEITKEPCEIDSDSGFNVEIWCKKCGSDNTKVYLLGRYQAMEIFCNNCDNEAEESLR